MNICNNEFGTIPVMLEKDIKIKVFEYLIKNEKHSVIVPEITIGNKIKMNTSGAVRADIFAVNGDISIYEIKSERDSLERLPNQLDLYQQNANRVSIVIADKFMDKIDFISDDIGIYSYNNRGIKCIRKPISNEIDLDRYISYWWGSELKLIFKGIKGATSLHLDAAKEKLRELLNDEQIKNLTLFRLQERYKDESDMIKDIILEKDYDSLFPKKKFDRKINLTPLKDVPFGVINKLN